MFSEWLSKNTTMRAFVGLFFAYPFSFMRAGSRALAALLGASLLSMAHAQALPPELQRSWQASRLPQGAFALHVQEVSGPVLMSVNAGNPVNPASVMKLVTTWGALSALGPNYMWRTAFYSQPGARVDDQGTLQGPLYLKAGADPFLSNEELWSLLRELRLRGIKNLSEVVVDRSIFGQVAIDPGQFDGAGDRPYNASPDAMMVGLGTVRLLFQPDHRLKQWIPIVDPPVKGVRVSGSVEWSDAVCPGSPRVSTQVVQTANDVVVQVAGKAAGSCGDFSVYRLALPQQQHFEATFQLLWRELGGTLARGIRSGQVPAGAALVAWRDSEPLSDAIRWINKQSNNVMARTLLLTLGAETLGAGATVQSGAQALLEVLRSQGVDTRGWVLDNGSGLSRDGRVTAAGLATMLQAAWASSYMPEFVSSLAIAGVDGTVRRRLRDADTRGVAHLKTGSLRDVSALAGYVLGASGKRYILVSVVNHEQAGAIRSFNDDLVSWLAAR